MLLILSSIYPISKTILDVHIFLSTGRLVETEDWVKLTIKKQEKIALDTLPNEKRILIISGSNALFGLSAKTISQETGVKTINLGSHFGLGGEYILNRSKGLLQKGDIILLPLEYPFYSYSGISDDFGQGRLLSHFIISYDRQLIKEISPFSIASFTVRKALSQRGKREYLEYFRGNLSKKDISRMLKARASEGDCYTSFTLNNYGDQTCNNSAKPNGSVNPRVLSTAIPESLQQQHIDPSGYIEEFVQYATEKGVKIIPLYPVSTHTKDYEYSTFKQSAQAIKKFWEDQGVPFQDSLENSILHPELMYDTEYHPNDTGRAKRTKFVMDLINEK